MTREQMTGVLEEIALLMTSNILQIRREDV